MPEQDRPVPAPETVNIVVLDEGDNVGIATRDIGHGEIARNIHGRGIPAQEAIPQGHKVALCPIAFGAPVIRCGVIVAQATRAIIGGELVHVHNDRQPLFDERRGSL